MKEYEFNGIKYQLLENEKEAFDYEEIKEKATDYFNDYDYIFGDIAYNKVRLKGFYEESSKKVNKINNIKFLDNYIKNYCAYECKWFLLKKMQ